MRILLVDDAKFARLMLGNMVREFGHDVVAEAVDGLDAIRKYKVHKPDLVIMDITMPVMNGIEATRRIKAINPTANIVIASAMGQREVVINAIKSGAMDFIVKPFQKTKIEEVLKKIQYTKIA